MDDPGRKADPDGFDATTEGDRSRQARTMAALELEPDTYDHPDHHVADAEYGEEETMKLMSGFGNGKGASLNGRSRGGKRDKTADAKASGAFVASLLGSLSSISSSITKYLNKPPASAHAAHHHSAFSIRNLILITGLAALTFLFVDNADVPLEMIHSQFTSSQIDDILRIQTSRGLTKVGHRDDDVLKSHPLALGGSLGPTGMADVVLSTKGGGVRCRTVSRTLVDLTRGELRMDHLEGDVGVVHE